MSQESSDFRTWIPVLDSLLTQVYYRVLSFVSFHGSIQESFDAATELSTIEGPVSEQLRGGSVSWVLQDRVWLWENVTVFPGITMNVWGFGSPIRGKNTVLARAGWWKLWVIESYIARRKGEKRPEYHIPTTR